MGYILMAIPATALILYCIYLYIYCKPSKVDGVIKSNYSTTKNDILADYMARAMIMPAEKVYKYIQEKDPSYDDALAYLITTYNVSSDMAAIRLAEIAKLENSGFFVNPADMY